MVTRHRWTHLFTAPAAFWFVNSTKTSLIFEHQPHFACWFWLTLFSCFQHTLFNFFEASHASLLAAFGCLDLGITFRHLCRFNSIYMYPRPVSFPRTLSNAFFISCAVITWPASAFFSNSSNISFSCSSVSARLCPVYLFCTSPSKPSSLYRLNYKYTVLLSILSALAISAALTPSYHRIRTLSLRLIFLSFVAFSASQIASYSSSVIWNFAISHHPIQLYYILSLLSISKMRLV